jgi:L-2,4-diaminobutyrate decarboxylase
MLNETMGDESSTGPDTGPDVLAAVERDTGADVAALFTALAAEYLAQTRTGEGAVSTAHTPDEIASRFDEPLPRVGHAIEDVVARVRDEVIPDCNRLYHPRYVGHQVSAPLPAAIWSESVIGALNQSVAVWEMSPVATILEDRVLRWMCDLVGVGAGAGGTFTSGGTEATFAALLAARSAAIPNVWTDGVGTEPPVIVCGEHAHYAVTRATGEMGLGMKSVVVIPSRDWRMDVDALRATLDQLAADGRAVMAVVATAGSTATGSFDDLEAIGAICDARGLWFHVDGAHGATALLSSRDRSRVRGIERARSLAWDPHKMMLMPLSAGVVLVRDERDLEGAFAQRAPYLFHNAEGERIRDQGTRSFQCSRRADVLKVWIALQRYGADGIGALYDHLCDRARAMHALLDARDDFVVLHEPECNILCFRFVGDGTLDDERLDALNRELRERYNRSGEGWITTTVLGGRRVLRVTIMNPRTTDADLAAIVDGVGQLGRELERTA